MEKNIGAMTHPKNNCAVRYKTVAGSVSDGNCGMIVSIRQILQS
ncbi:hypothetical protein [Solitalea canadensis]|nr:hypothetical protein [Solitalea canadensis]